MNKEVIQYFTKKHLDNTLFSKTMKRIYEDFIKQRKKIDDLVK